MYEVVLTRLLSVLCWYYLAFVSISMAMFGMTAGALAVQLQSDWFHRENVPKRLVQATFAMAISLPLVLVTVLAVPLEISRAVETFFSFLLFSALIAVPFSSRGSPSASRSRGRRFPSAASTLPTFSEPRPDALRPSCCSG